MSSIHPNASPQLQQLSAFIANIKDQIKRKTSAKNVSYYEDDKFAFQIDENGHEIARIKANQKYKQATEAIESQRQEILMLKDENEYFSQQMRKLESNYINLLNKYKTLMEYIKPLDSYEIFRKEFSQEVNDDTNQEVVYRIIEIPIQREVIVEIPVEIQKIVIKEVETVIEVPIQIERTIEVERIVEVERVVEVPVEQIVYVDRPIEITRDIVVIKQIEVPVQIERIVEVQRIVEVEVEVEKIVEVERIVEVEVERIVEVERVVQVERIFEVQKIVQKVVEVQCVVQVQKIVQVQRIVEVQRIVQVQKIIQMPIEVQVIRQVEVVKQVIKEIRRDVFIPIEVIVQKLIEVPIINEPQELEQATIFYKQREIRELHEQIQQIDKENQEYKSIISNFKNLYETELAINQQSNEVIAKLNKEISSLKEGHNPSNSVLVKEGQDIGEMGEVLLNSTSEIRMKLLCNRSTKQIIQKLNKNIGLIGQELAQQINSSIYELSVEAQAKEAANHQMKTIIKQLQTQISNTQLPADSDTSQIASLQAQLNDNMNLLQQCQGEKLLLIKQISLLKRQNYQIKLQLNREQQTNQTEQLIQNLTLLLSQQKTNNAILQEQNSALQLQVEEKHNQLVQKNKRIELLILNLSNRDSSMTEQDQNY